MKIMRNLSENARKKREPQNETRAGMKSVELEAVPDVLIRAFKFAEILDVFLRCEQVFRNVERRHRGKIGIDQRIRGEYGITQQ